MTEQQFQLNSLEGVNLAALNNDTRLVMTILFVGTLSGANVYTYAKIGTGFPYGPLAHSILFGLGTIGSIMIMKALFDLVLNDKIELMLLDRRIAAYWERTAREETQRQKMRESAKQYNNNAFAQYKPMTNEEEGNVVGNEFLATLQ